MGDLFSLSGAALLVFAATNIDDLLLLVVLFSDRRRQRLPGAVLVGQVLGFGAIVLISLLGFCSGLVIPSAWMACLGLLPLALGLRQLLNLRRSEETANALPRGFVGHPEQDTPLPAPWRRTSVKVAALTLANGSDNVSVYLPLFGRLSQGGVVITLFTFFCGLVVLWVFAQWLSQHSLWQHRIQTLGPRASPLVLMALGVWLLKDSVLWPFPH